MLGLLSANGPEHTGERARLGQASRTGLKLKVETAKENSGRDLGTKCSRPKCLSLELSFASWEVVAGM